MISEVFSDLNDSVILFYSNTLSIIRMAPFSVSEIQIKERRQ